MKVTIDVPPELFANAIISGYAGGIAYWCHSTHGDCHRSPDTGRWRIDLSLTTREPHKGRRVFRLNAPIIAKGLATMAATMPVQFGNLLAGKSDAITGDTLIQCCLFGEIVYA